MTEPGSIEIKCPVVPGSILKIYRTGGERRPLAAIITGHYAGSVSMSHETVRRLRDELSAWLGERARDELGYVTGSLVE